MIFIRWAFQSQNQPMRLVSLVLHCWSSQQAESAAKEKSLLHGAQQELGGRNKEDNWFPASVTENHKKVDEALRTLSEQILFVSNNAAEQFTAITKQQEEMKTVLTKFGSRLQEVEKSLRIAMESKTLSKDPQDVCCSEDHQGAAQADARVEVVSDEDDAFEPVPLDDLSGRLAGIMREFAKVKISIQPASKQGRTKSSRK